LRGGDITTVGVVASGGGYYCSDDWNNVLLSLLGKMMIRRRMEEMKMATTMKGVSGPSWYHYRVTFGERQPHSS
jgi:hypothetical protein